MAAMIVTAAIFVVLLVLLVFLRLFIAFISRWNIYELCLAESIADSSGNERCYDHFKQGVYADECYNEKQDVSSVNLFLHVIRVAEKQNECSHEEYRVEKSCAEACYRAGSLRFRELFRVHYHIADNEAQYGYRSADEKDELL